MADVSQIAAWYGSDLIDPPDEWRDLGKCKSLLREFNMAPGVGSAAFFLLEIFAGCAHLSEAARSLGLPVGPPVDIKPAIGGDIAYDLLQAYYRKLVWALIVVGAPLWIHVGFPCTFWSMMAHLTRKDDAQANEAKRLEQLVFIFFARQIGEWQVSRGRHISIENPPRCRSWALDVVQDMVTRWNLSSVDFDSCMYGAVDPGNGLYFKKAMRIAMSLPLDGLHVRCNKSHEHQTVHSVVDSGPRKGTPRTQVSGEYPKELCRRWVTLVQAAIGAGAGQ